MIWSGWDTLAQQLRTGRRAFCCAILLGYVGINIDLPSSADGIKSQRFRRLRPQNQASIRVSEAAPDKYSSIYSFGPPGHHFRQADGQAPVSELFNVGGTLYGTTTAGGEYGGGTVFEISPRGSSERVLHSFGRAKDGLEPLSSLISENGKLYGTTAAGGANGAGTVFEISPSGERIIYDFKVGTDGFAPEAGLIAFNGRFYGTTFSGGTSGNGTVFSVDTAGNESVIHSFEGGYDGAQPQASLIASNGKLYGTTYAGGAVGNGTVFEISGPNKERVVYDFKVGTDGAGPTAKLLALGGKLYGTTSLGGLHGYGTVFEVSPAGSESVVYSFGSFGGSQGTIDGYYPLGDLITRDGALYGTTYSGFGYSSAGGGTEGTIFKLSLTGTESVIYGFKVGTDGQKPFAGLIDVDGRLFGTTAAGGLHGNGTVFELIP